MLKKKNNDINGKYTDWTGISPDTLTEIIAWFKNVVKAKIK